MFGQDPSDLAKMEQVLLTHTREGFAGCVPDWDLRPLPYRQTDSGKYTGSRKPSYFDDLRLPLFPVCVRRPSEASPFYATGGFCPFFFSASFCAISFSYISSPTH